MKHAVLILATSLMIALLPSTLLAQDTESIGGDVYAGGSNPTLSTNVPRDAFAYGFSVSLSGDVGKDAHAAGFDVEIDSAVGADLYAVGANVSVRGAVQEDLTISGFSVRLSDKASIGGNARISAGNMTIAAPIGGSLLAAGGSIKLDAPVTGAVRMTAADITFGDNARIGGSLTYSAPEEIDIPASVIAPDRVRYVAIAKSGFARDLRRTFDESVPSFWPSFFGIVSGVIVTFAFLLIVAAIFLAFLPDAVEKLRSRATRYPGLSLLFGFLGLSMLFGLVPVSALTLVGLPFIPIVILVIVAFWILGYLLGAYAIATRLWEAFGNFPDTMTSKLLVLASGLVALAIVNFIPFIGWLLNLAVVLFGLGSIIMLLTNQLAGRGAFTYAAEAIEQEETPSKKADPN